MRKYEKILGWFFLAMTPLVLPLLIVTVCELLPAPPDIAIQNVLVYAVEFLLTLLIFHRFLWQNARQSLQHPGRSFLWMGVGFAAYNIGSYLVAMLVAVLAPDFSNSNDANILQMLQAHFWPMFICIVILVPITEETLYRGLLFGSLRKKCRWLAYAVSICAFSALHVVGYIGTLRPLELVVSFLQYLPGSFALALAYDKSDSVWPGILIHASVNLFATISMLSTR